MTHEYVILTGGVVHGGRTSATALCWAADRILAVGGDDEVRALSRGDSTFLDLEGRAVTPAPADTVGAQARLRAAVAAGGCHDPLALLGPPAAGPGAIPIEPGSPAEFAIWSCDPAALDAAGADRLYIVTVVRGGHFDRGDPHQGPLRRVLPARRAAHGSPAEPAASGSAAGRPGGAGSGPEASAGR